MRFFVHIDKEECFDLFLGGGLVVERHHFFWR
ncbi:hypothetical protein BTM_3803 [Burkholderia thailandensis 34]|nr:hypothetical protein BTM_3803 [Burkholderia thailandensis 34]